MVVREMHRVAAVLVDQISAQSGLMLCGRASWARVSCTWGGIVSPCGESEEGRREEALRWVPHPD
eukprot:5568358-Pyramimonas_sp.AAC.1